MEKLQNMSVEEFKEYCDEQETLIETERKRRQEIQIEVDRRQNKSKIDFLKKNLGFLDLINHCRTSCSDDRPINGDVDDKGYARCNKCHIMEILEYEDDSWNITIDASAYKSF